ncbi:MAG TPA: TetR family transcriptional regulator [Pyrinomonadaceae bacterium]|jgi:AcrR family transcriptional regulator|nr:TetR family transcriptional regulator [Pyrinomonadaceae bacterium]
MATKKTVKSVTKKRARAAKPRPSGRRAQNKLDIRARIVRAALDLFQTKGFDATTTKAIARKARIAEGTVFNYFKTKDDIALHFFEQEVDQAMATVRENPRLRNAPLEEKLFALVHSQLEYLARHERFIGAALIHALKPASPLGPFSHRSQELRHRYLGFVEELIEESSPKHERGPLSFFAPEVFWIYYLGVLLYWLNDSSEGKQNTLAFLDRSLNVGVSMFKRGWL